MTSMTSATAVALPTALALHPPHPAACGTSQAATSLRSFLAKTGALIHQGLPRRLWIEASVVAAKASRFGHTLELVDPDPPPAPPAHLRAFLSTDACDDLRRQIGPAFDPQMLIGTTVIVEIEPSFNPKWHLQARIHRVSGDVTASLHGKLVDKLRERLKADGLYARQKALLTPRDITRLAIIHPQGAAGFADVARELHLWSDAGLLDVVEVVTPFEGAAAPNAIAEAIAKASRPLDGRRPDVIVMVRGGGGRSGFLWLDTEAVVRAACLCDVPIIVGVGHATDRCLLDEICWRAVDTPSKALTAIADLIVGPARRARADFGLVQTHADRILDDAARALAQLCGEVGLSASQHLATSQASLREIEARIDGHGIGAGERMHRCSAEAGSILERIMASVRNTVHHAERQTAHALRSIIETSRRLAETSDPGAIMMAQIQVRGAALIEHHRRNAVDLDRAVRASGARYLAAMEADLIHQITLVASLAPERTLARGYVLVREEPAGAFITTAAALSPGRHVVLCFADGDVAVTVEDPTTGHEAGASS